MACYGKGFIVSLPLFSQTLLGCRKQRARHTFQKVSYLAQDIEKTLIKRLPKNRENLNKILIIGCPAGLPQIHLKGVVIDAFDPFLEKSFVENNLPFQDNHYDLVLEGFVFHWLNDPLGYLRDIKRLLKSGGLYLSGFLGGTTLTEMRQALLKTDIDLYGGAFARVSPMIKPEAATRLLQSADFQDAVVEHEEIGVSYPHIKSLIQDLRAMGESNALRDQRSPKISKDYFERAQQNYSSLFPQKDESLVATFDLVHMIGWSS